MDTVGRKMNWSSNSELFKFIKRSNFSFKSKMTLSTTKAPMIILNGSL